MYVYLWCPVPSRKQVTVLVEGSPSFPVLAVPHCTFTCAFLPSPQYSFTVEPLDWWSPRNTISPKFVLMHCLHRAILIHYVITSSQSTLLHPFICSTIHSLVHLYPNSHLYPYYATSGFPSGEGSRNVPSSDPVIDNSPKSNLDVSFNFFISICNILAPHIHFHLVQPQIFYKPDLLSLPKTGLRRYH